MKALVFDRVGQATEVLSLREVAAPEAGAGEVLVQVEARPVHPADISFVRNTYRIRPKLPQIAGLSGVGRVVAVGAGLEVPIGTRVAFRWPGAWADLVAVPVERMIVAPEDVATDDAAQFALNPVTAWGLLDVAEVSGSAWVGLTAPSSSVARIVSALARLRGLRTVDVAPRPGELAAISEQVRAATAGEGLSALIDCVGGPLITDLFPTLRQGATLVTYGTLSSEPATVPNAALVYSNLTWKGFGIDRWLQGLRSEKRREMLDTLWQAVRDGHLPLPVSARLPLARFEEALAATGGTAGKVLLV
jgi:NADPH:quinone reductase-like Zn-dependent oxidoreductase